MKVKLSSLSILLMALTINDSQAIRIRESYKSDALDELLEGSLFKKKTREMPQTDDLVDEAMHAQVDPKIFNIDDSTKTAKKDKQPADSENL